MALVVANRVQETTTTAGTGTITLAGASAGYQSFAVIGNGNTTYYTIVDGNNWEVGIGTYTASGTTLSRDTVLSSSASGAKITLSGNTARVFVDYPAEKAISDGYGTLPVANGGTNGTATPTAGAVAYGTGTAYAFTSAGTSGQVLTSSGSGAPTWATASGGAIASNPRTLLTTKTIAYGVTPTRFAGSVNLSDTTQMLFVADGTNYYASVYDSSSDTMGSAVSVGTVAGGLAVVKLSSTSVLIGYASGGTFSARVLSVSGTTLTANTAATVATSCTFLHGDPATLGSTYVFSMTYTAGTACNLIAATVSGTTVTLGSATSVSATADTGNAYYPVAAYSSTTGFAIFKSSATTQVSYRGFSVSGTTITLSGTTRSGPFASNTIAYHTLSNGKVMVIHLDSSNAFSYSLISMSGTTVTLSYTQPATLSTAASAGMYSVVDGNSVLLVVTTAAGTGNTQANAIVIRDNSGTIAVSSVTAINSSNSTGISIIPASATTIMVCTPAFSAGAYSYIVSIVSNAPSVASTINSVAQPGGIVANYPFGAYYTSVPQANAANYNFSTTLAGGNFYVGSLAGTSGNYYRMTNEGFSYSPNPTTVTTKICMANFVSGNPIIDTTITGGCWYATFETNTLLYRVQYA